MRPDESSRKYTLLSVAVKPRKIPLVFFLSSLAHLSEPGLRAKTLEPKTRSLLTSDLRPVSSWYGVVGIEQCGSLFLTMTACLRA